MSSLLHGLAYKVIFYLEIIVVYLIGYVIDFDLKVFQVFMKACCNDIVDIIKFQLGTKLSHGFFSAVGIAVTVGAGYFEQALFGFFETEKNRTGKIFIEHQKLYHPGWIDVAIEPPVGVKCRNGFQ